MSAATYLEHDRVMFEYYNNRAPVYDRIYDPSRSTPALSEMADVVRDFARDRRILEVASGTGYWTNVAAQTAMQITATDVTPNTAAIARSKNMPSGIVKFEVADAYNLQNAPGKFDAAMAVQWFSHVPKRRHAEFFRSLHGKLEPGSRVFFGDNFASIEKMTKSLIRIEGEPDTYQDRRLPDGSTYRIIKNFFDCDELTQIFGRFPNFEFRRNDVWWWVKYTLP